MSLENSRNNRPSSDEAIPLFGGGEAPSSPSSPVSAHEAYIPTKEEVEKAVANAPRKNKKKSKGKKILLWAASLLVLLLLAAGVCTGLALYDNMPPAPTETSSVEDVMQKSMKALISGEKLTLTSADLNALISEELEKAEASLLSQGITLKETFVVMSDNGATLYIRADYKKITLPVRVRFNVSFDTPNVVITLDSVKIGYLSIPDSIANRILTSLASQSGMEAGDGVLFLDTTLLNDAIIAAVRENAGIAGLEDALDDFLSIFGGKFNLGDMISIAIKDMYIMDNQLIVETGRQ
ncbi:MAG: hypothetical protein LBL82_01635 [Oscillospiraceae bacterium]|jgi:hypothetical protein|nr:hypothetical protein [Oscillospiraceae bacterium]